MTFATFFRFLLTVLSNMLSSFTPTQAILQRTILITMSFFFRFCSRSPYAVRFVRRR